MVLVKTSQFKKYLESLGVIVTNGKNHWHLRYKEKWTILKRHPSQELSNVHRDRILRQLGLK